MVCVLQCTARTVESPHDAAGARDRIARIPAACGVAAGARVRRCRRNCSIFPCALQAKRRRSVRRYKFLHPVRSITPSRWRISSNPLEDFLQPVGGFSPTRWSFCSKRREEVRRRDGGSSPTGWRIILELTSDELGYCAEGCCRGYLGSVGSMCQTYCRSAE